MREGRGNHLKYLKRGWNRKEGGTKILKRGGKLVQDFWALNRGVGMPLQTFYTLH